MALSARRFNSMPILAEDSWFVIKSNYNTRFSGHDYADLSTNPDPLPRWRFCSCHDLKQQV